MTKNKYNLTCVMPQLSKILVSVYVDGLNSHKVGWLNSTSIATNYLKGE